MTTRQAREQQRGEKRAWRGEHRERKRLRGEYQPPSPVRQEFRTRELADCERIVTIASVNVFAPKPELAQLLGHVCVFHLMYSYYSSACSYNSNIGLVKLNPTDLVVAITDVKTDVATDAKTDAKQ